MIDVPQESVLKDTRTISRLYVDPIGWITVGFAGVQSIEVVACNGEMAPVAWFDVKYEQDKALKINGKYVVSIEYKTQTTEANSVLSRV